MAARFGINGFGRIGRMVMRAAIKKSKEKCGGHDTPVLVAINDPYMSADQMANRFKHDSTHGMFHGDVNVLGGAIIVDGQIIEVSNEKDPAKIPWNKGCASYVVEASGLFTTYEKAGFHLHEGVKRVLISTISQDVPIFVMGVNHECYNNHMDIVSVGNCSVNALTPMVKVLHDNFEIEYGLVTTIHAITNSQNVLDGPNQRDYRKGRGIHNIIPTACRMADAIGRILPDLDGKIQALSIRVPVPNGALLDLNVKLKKEAGYDLVKCRIKEASETYMKGILGYTEEKIVSSDIIGDSRSAIFDATAGVAVNKVVMKLVAWYDNEWSMSCRIVDMMKYMATREVCP